MFGFITNHASSQHHDIRRHNQTHRVQFLVRNQRWHRRRNSWVVVCRGRGRFSPVLHCLSMNSILLRSRTHLDHFVPQIIRQSLGVVRFGWEISLVGDELSNKMMNFRFFPKDKTFFPGILKSEFSYSYHITARFWYKLRNIEILCCIIFPPVHYFYNFSIFSFYFPPIWWETLLLGGIITFYSLRGEITQPKFAHLELVNLRIEFVPQTCEINIQMKRC